MRLWLWPPRARRRDRRIGRALHELRRPAQALALALERQDPDVVAAAACLTQLRAALAELEDAVEARNHPLRVIGIGTAEIVTELERRWRCAGGVEVLAADLPARVAADPERIGAALDNLVANALEHGSGPVRVVASAAAGSARFEVRDGGPAAKARPGGSPDRRRGHGLAVVAGAARSHGGELLAPRPVPGGTLSGLEIPLAARNRDPSR